MQPSSVSLQKKKNHQNAKAQEGKAQRMAEKATPKGRARKAQLPY